MKTPNEEGYEWVDEILDNFKDNTEDLCEQFMEGDDPDPQKYDDFLNSAHTEAKTLIIQNMERSIRHAITEFTALLNKMEGEK